MSQEASPVDLSGVLTPSLFKTILKTRIPFLADQSPLDFNKINAFYFRNEADPQLNNILQETAFPVLQTLSKIPPQDLLATDLLIYLPPPTSLDFPLEALGLLMFLDQAPRYLCQGVNTRWCNSFFDLIAIKLAHQYRELPEALRPWNKTRWISELGYSFDHWIITRIWFTAPFCHSESLSDHGISAKLTSDLRDEMELFLGKRGEDPYSSTEETWKLDVYAFNRILGLGGPVMADDKIEMGDFVWWLRMLFDCHRPIIDKFGRYPYRNGANGRASTDAEKEYLEKVEGFFGSGDREVEKRVREDVENGRWTPLVK